MSNKERYTILIVEDDEDLMEMLGGYFHVQGYDVLRAHWGQEAIDLATQHIPDLILQDIRLPDIDGFTVIGRLRKQRKTKNIPVIFLTERRERKDRLTGLELGAVDYVTKPFDVQELRLRVQNVVQRIESDTYFNPITSMPDGLLLRNEIESMLKANDWGMVTAGVRGIENFRNRYGFVAADDVTRSVSLILTRVCEEEQIQKPFVGQLGPAEFVIITTAERTEKIAKQCETWLEPAIPWFYPMETRETLPQIPDDERLSPIVSQLSSTKGITSYEGLRNYLTENW